MRSPNTESTEATDHKTRDATYAATATTPSVASVATSVSCPSVASVATSVSCAHHRVAWNFHPGCTFCISASSSRLDSPQRR
jgi:hypothetical protein